MTPGEAPGAALATLRQPSSLRRKSTLSTDWDSSKACASTPVGAPSWWLGTVSSGDSAGRTVGCTAMARGAVAIEQVAGDCACATPARHNKDSVVIVRRMFVL